MISRENYYIRELQNSSKGDPGLIERTLYAFGLLEALRRVGMEFTFKGGTSLLLLLSRPKIAEKQKGYETKQKKIALTAKDLRTDRKRFESRQKKVAWVSGLW